MEHCCLLDFSRRLQKILRFHYLPFMPGVTPPSLWVGYPMSTPSGKFMSQIESRKFREFIPHKQWRYVPTGENPADIASRGMSPRQLISSELWWKGPPWLSRPPDFWPTHPSPTSVVLPEARIYIARVKKPPDDLTALWSRYSSHNHLLRVITWMKRFCYNSRHPDSKLLQPALQSDELENTRTMLLKLTQK